MSLKLIELQQITDKISQLLQDYTETLNHINKESKEYLSSAQRNYLTNLINNKVENKHNQQKLLKDLDSLTKLEASDLIQKINAKQIS